MPMVSLRAGSTLVTPHMIHPELIDLIITCVRTILSKTKNREWMTNSLVASDTSKTIWETPSKCFPWFLKFLYLTKTVLPDPEWPVLSHSFKIYSFRNLTEGHLYKHLDWSNTFHLGQLDRAMVLNRPYMLLDGQFLEVFFMISNWTF